MNTHRFPLGQAAKKASAKAVKAMRGDAPPLLLLEGGPCTHCGAYDSAEAAYLCPVYASPSRACHGESPN